MLTTMDTGNLLAAGLLQAAWNGGTALKCHLYQNAYTPVPTTVLSDFVEATYSGYVAQVIASWSSPVLVADDAHINPAPLIWQNTTGVTGNTVYGYYVTDLSGTQLWFGEAFTTPQAMTVALAAFALQIDFTLTHS